ncbi:uncharacterized protein TNCV_2854441 [Trichonephila clavipes]|nr:uncharacterized protein TNCV_2854441 [Trichonephila clavipes]
MSQLITQGFAMAMNPLHLDTTRGLLATDHVILNHGQVTWTTPELAPPLLTTTPHQREDVSALDRFNVHHCPTRRVFSGTGLDPVTKQTTVRYLYHSATAATLAHEGEGIKQQRPNDILQTLFLQHLTLRMQQILSVYDTYIKKLVEISYEVAETLLNMATDCEMLQVTSLKTLEKKVDALSQQIKLWSTPGVSNS